MAVFGRWCTGLEDRKGRTPVGDGAERAGAAGQPEPLRDVEHSFQLTPWPGRPSPLTFLKPLEWPC